MVDRDHAGGPGKMVDQRLRQEVARAVLEAGCTRKASELRHLKPPHDRFKEHVEPLASLGQVARPQAMGPAGLVPQGAEGRCQALPHARRQAPEKAGGDPAAWLRR